MSKTLLFIINPRAGRTRTNAPMLDALAQFSNAGYLIRIRQTAARGDATRFVCESGAEHDLIVCCGGDGTLNEVVTGAMQLSAPPPIGYIPCGSTNDFAASLHLSSNPVETAERICRSEGKWLDVGSFNSRPFAYVASFGAFTRASYSAPQTLKNDLGHLAYLLEGVKDLSTLRPYHARIEADGEVFDGEFLFGAVTNATSLGGVMKLKESYVEFDDGCFELTLIPNPKTAQELQSLIRSLLTQDFDNGGLFFRHVSSLHIRTPEAFPWSLDGEYDAGGEEISIRNLRRRLCFMI